ncbi:MAG: cupin domain-containing protein [Acidobacteria bacterium]|nr:cupin domain-containing protein [Acidobacteriota bacterium]
MVTPEQLIKYLHLELLPVEGGYFRQSYRSAEAIPRQGLPARYRSEKAFCTAIYYLLTSDPDSFSALHRLPTDEMYHFYLGDPVQMLLLHPDGRSQRVVLGSDVLNGQQVQFVVPRDVWQGSRLLPGGRLALLGTTMAPGFDPDDFLAGDRGALIHHYPDCADFIRSLTRPR